MSKYTPGPWKQEGYRLFANQFAKPEYPIHAPKRGLIAKSFKEEDARLIASAPELLEALKDLLADEGEDFIRSRFWDKARAAIAKAEGGEA